MRLGNTIAILLTLLFFDNALAESPVVRREEMLGGKYFCGYGKINNVVTADFAEEAPYQTFVTEYSPNLKYDQHAYVRLTSGRGGMTGLVSTVWQSNIKRESFFRKQEILSHAYENRLTVQILTDGTLDSRQHGYCAPLPWLVTIKLCRVPADCCSGYRNCGKEGEGVRTFRTLSAASEVSYE